MALLPLLFLLSTLKELRRWLNWRESALAAAVAFGIVLAVTTEVLSAFHVLRPVPVALSWSILAAGGMWLARSSMPIPPISLPAPMSSAARTAAFGIAFVFAATLMVALVAPPNNWDSMTYHLPRVVYWAQNASVEPYPAHTTRQLTLAPWSEYAMLHLRILSGGDRWFGLVSWFSLGGCALAVSLIARELSGGRDASVFAALAASTASMCVLEGSSTQNDLPCAMWVSIFALCSMRDAVRSTRITTIGMALSLALAMLTKNTAPFFAAPFGVWWLIRRMRQYNWARLGGQIGIVAVATTVLNGPFWLRNLKVFGSPLGDPRVTRFAVNTHPGLSALVSNVARNLSIHASTPSLAINRSLTAGIGAILGTFGIDSQDVGTTASVSPFYIDVTNWHEAKAGSSLAVALALMATIAILIRGTPLARGYVAATWSGFFLFCLLLRWEPWNGRLHVPFLVLAAPFVGVACGRIAERTAGVLLTLTMISSSILSICLSETRPVATTGNETIFTVPRENQYFAEHPRDQKQYFDTVDVLKQSGCGRVGLLMSTEVPEYTLFALAQSEGYTPQWIQLGVENPSGLLKWPSGDAVCAVVALDDGVPQRLRPKNLHSRTVEPPVTVYGP